MEATEHRADGAESALTQFDSNQLGKFPTMSKRDSFSGFNSRINRRCCSRSWCWQSRNSYQAALNNDGNFLVDWIKRRGRSHLIPIRRSIAPSRPSKMRAGLSLNILETRTSWNIQESPRISENLRESPRIFDNWSESWGIFFFKNFGNWNWNRMELIGKNPKKI